MAEKREYLKSRFIYPECAKQLLRQFRFKSAEEVKDAIEHAERQSKKMQEENNIQRQILLGVSQKSPETRLFRNNVGLGYMGTVAREEPPVIVLRNYRYVKYGLHVGSSDLIGWKSIEITPDMIGKRVAVFASVEVKTETGKPTAEQKNWIDQVRKAGGIAGVVRSVDDAVRLLETGSNERS